MVMVARRRTSGLGRLRMQTRVGACARNLAGKSNCGPAAARGPGLTGGILLRDREGALTNPVSWAADNAGDTREERTYACSDFRGSVSALVSETGTLAEQYRYSATGVPMGIPLGDVKVDGIVAGGAGADSVKAEAARIAGIGSYSVEMDTDLDGVITTADTGAVTARSGRSLGMGKLSEASVGWRVGWKGMEWVSTTSVYFGAVGLYIPYLDQGTSGVATVCEVPFDCEETPPPNIDAIPEQYRPYVSLNQFCVIVDPSCPPEVRRALRDGAYNLLVEDYNACRTRIPGVTRPIRRQLRITCSSCEDASTPTGQWGDSIELCPSAWRDIVDPKSRREMVEDQLRHELTHIRQKCDLQGNLYQSCEAAICQEVEAYCNEQGRATTCRLSATYPDKWDSLCQTACKSASPACGSRFSLTSRFDACVARCKTMQGQCAGGRYTPPTVIAPSVVTPVGSCAAGNPCR